MRLLQLNTGPGELLDLHPNVTIVQGLDRTSHQLLVATVAGLARADTGGSTGLLEAHGVLFDLDTDLLALLDLDGLDLDPVVRPGDLPTQPLTVDARELRAREQEFAELLARISAQAERQSQARGAVAAAAAALEHARRARTDAEATSGSRQAELEALRARVESLAVERGTVEAELAAHRSERDAADQALSEALDRSEVASAAAEAAHAAVAALTSDRDALALAHDEAAFEALEAAQAHLAAERAAVDSERAVELDAVEQLQLLDDAAGPAAVEPAAVRLERAEARCSELERLLLALESVDTGEVAEALALLEGGDSGDLVESAEARALADELEALGPDGDDDPALSERSLSGARARLDDANQALLEAEQAVRNPELDRDDVLALEDAHAELFDAIERSDRRFGGSRARGRVDELRAKEQEILDRLGFTSYADYMMGNSLFQIDPEKEATLEAAREELTAAEAEWHRLQRATDEALARAARLDRRRGLLDEARRLLGAGALPDDVPAALRALRVPVVSASDSASRLHAALDRAGLDLGDDELDHLELTIIAEAWLSEAGDVERRRSDARAERDQLAAELDALRAEAAAAAEREVSPTSQAPDPEALRVARVAAAEAAVADAERRWLAHEEAVERSAEVAAALDAAVAAAEAAMAEATAAQAAAEDIAAATAPAVDRGRALDEALEAIARAEDEVAAELRARESDAASDPAALAAAVAASEAAHREAVASLEAESRALEVLDADGKALAIEIERLQDIVAAQGTGSASEAEELEWYLLARLAAQRSVSVAGSLPLLLDDALRGLDAPEIDHLLGRLEPMGEAVQVIVVSDDPLVAAWAEGAGPARAAVVRPGAP